MPSNAIAAWIAASRTCMFAELIPFVTKPSVVAVRVVLPIQVLEDASTSFAAETSPVTARCNSDSACDCIAGSEGRGRATELVVAFAADLLNFQVEDSKMPAPASTYMAKKL